MLLKIRKGRLKKFPKLQKRRKLFVKEHESNSDSDTMAEIDNYQDSSSQSSDDVKSSNDKSDSEDESSRDTQTGDEDEDPLSLPIFAKDISDKSYDLKTWIDEIRSFPTKISVRARVTVYRDLINLLVQEKFMMILKSACFDLREFTLIMGLNCSAYPRDAKLKKVLEKGDKFYYKVTKNKSITATKLMHLIKGSKLNKEQKLKCSLVLFVHTMLLAHDRSKIVDSSHIKMVDDLDFFNSYPWGKESFNLTLTYLKNKINLKKQSEVFNERENALYALYGFPWEFLVWIYEAFPHLGKYARKSLNSPLPIPLLLRWHTAKNVNIIECDPFKYKEKTTDLAVDDDNFSTPTVDDEILPLAIFAEEVDEEMNEEEMKEEEKEQDYEKMTKKEEEKLEENDEQKEEEKLEEKKEEESEEQNLEEMKNEENEASGEEEKEQQEKKITENEEDEKLEEESLATDVAEVEKEIDVMGIVMELNGEVGGDE
ncbi:hypothetical protein H5410_060269 [Solanum commersonii]|uniref:DUF1985 domain-containing protein n=1 Tax=Solanum commersonii TaxID=4109 RepID=A0A9J5W550_SOLCO|nr:hypothetical protein H5410_060269 [Solanum commersonii]